MKNKFFNKFNNYLLIYSINLMSKMSKKCKIKKLPRTTNIVQVSLFSIYFKYWLSIICIVTLFFSSISLAFGPTNFNYLSYLNYMTLPDAEILKKLTPSFPPPLINFMT